MIPYSVPLPSEEDLTVQEIPMGTAYLRAGAMHLGKVCEAQNNEFIMCRNELNDPRKCLDEGKEVTSCALDFFQKVKGSCAAEFTRYALCIEKSSDNMAFKPCRKTQAAFDLCMKEKLDVERPHFGYHCLMKVHQTNRPKVEPERPAYMDVPEKKIEGLPNDFPKEKQYWGNFYTPWGI